MPMTRRHVEHIARLENTFKIRNIFEQWKSIIIGIFCIDLIKQSIVLMLYNEISLPNWCCLALMNQGRRVWMNRWDRIIECIFHRRPRNTRIGDWNDRWVTCARRFCLGSLCKGEIVCFGPIHLKMSDDDQSFGKEKNIRVQIHFFIFMIIRSDITIIRYTNIFFQIRNLRLKHPPMKNMSCSYLIE